MQVLMLKLGEKAYTTGRANAFLARKSLELSQKSIEMAKKARDMAERGNDLDAISGLMQEMAEINDSKSWLICAIYGDKFTIEELEMSLTMEEINAEVNRISKAIMGVIPKNA